MDHKEKEQEEEKIKIKKQKKEEAFEIDPWEQSRPSTPMENRFNPFQIEIIGRKTSTTISADENAVKGIGNVNGGSNNIHLQVPTTTILKNPDHIVHKIP